MTDRYFVVIVDRNQYDLKEDEEYDLFEKWRNKEELPNGVWVQEWLVPDGEEWNTHPCYDLNYLIENDCHCIHPSEMDKPYLLKTQEYWAWVTNELTTVAEAIRPLIRQATTTLQPVREILDEHDERFHSDMPTSYEIADLVAFYAELAEEAMHSTAEFDGKDV